LVVVVMVALVFHTSHANERSLLAYAQTYDQQVTGDTDMHVFSMGPFYYRHNGQQIWSVPVRQGTLWMRASLFGDDVILVDHDGQQHKLR
jgi:hypothetical protein